MVSDQIRDDGSIADLPWAAAFDPAANARVLSSVQARGFRAATEVVNRFVRIAEEGLEGGGGASDGPAATPPGHDVDRVLSAWQKLADQLTRSLTGAGATTQTDEATLDLANATSAGQLCLDAEQPGAVSSEVWLHNGGAVDMGKVRLRCSDLLSHDGGVIASDMVRFEPDAVPMFARSSRGVTVEIDVGDDVAPGCYRGTLLADGHADVWLPIALIVRAPSA
ncbi:hypothetical protein [Mycolicibacterium holsaticum]|uniref:hypothetical protein n=1 Tax=Mycolicibacterium holsaticum TaxID=152142 RepID=UPI001E637AFC|nr:hypothetical protein [Mycolicibacterium holsaticum]MDA4109180.1 hypothetical protein [Mycolicibacterium holsaticum DSM 44478 = JCM 12374]